MCIDIPRKKKKKNSVRKTAKFEIIKFFIFSATLCFLSEKDAQKFH